jgi:hypothetical protein
VHEWSTLQPLVPPVATALGYILSAISNRAQKSVASSERASIYTERHEAAKDVAGLMAVIGLLCNTVTKQRRATVLRELQAFLAASEKFQSREVVAAQIEIILGPLPSQRSEDGHAKD